MLYVYYNSGGEAFSDFKVDKMMNDYAKQNYKDTNLYIETSTENVIYAVRVAIKEGKIDCDHVVVYFDATTVKFNKDAKPVNGNYPSTYFDESLDRLIGLV